MSESGPPCHQQDAIIDDQCSAVAKNVLLPSYFNGSVNRYLWNLNDLVQLNPVTFTLYVIRFSELICIICTTCFLLQIV